MRETLNRLPSYGFPGNDTLCTARVVPAKQPVLRRSPYAGMLFNGQGRPVNLDRPAPTLPASMGGNRTPIIDQHALDTEQPDWVVEYHARLVAGEPPAAHAPDRLRRLTVEEAAALQEFPAEWAWQGPLTARWAQIGNAVPPPLAKAVANAIGTALPQRSR